MSHLPNRVSDNPLKGNRDEAPRLLFPSYVEGQCIIMHRSPLQGVNKLTIFSKFTILSMKVLLPSCVKVISGGKQTIKRELNDNDGFFF